MPREFWFEVLFVILATGFFWWIENRDMLWMCCAIAIIGMPIRWTIVKRK